MMLEGLSCTLAKVLLCEAIDIAEFWLEDAIENG